MDIETKSNNLNRYDIEIKKYKLIPLETEKKLCSEMLNGNILSRNKLITGNLRLVMKIASNYKNMGVEIEELICEGNKGLIIATNNYNPNLGCKFSSYAYFWIKQSILASITEHNKWSGTSNKNILNYDDYDEKLLSVNMDIFEDDNYVVKDILKKVNELSSRDSIILKHYFGLNGFDELNTIELSKKFNISTMRVSDIIENSIRKIRCKTLENIYC